MLFGEKNIKIFLFLYEQALLQIIFFCPSFAVKNKKEPIAIKVQHTRFY